MERHLTINCPPPPPPFLHDFSQKFLPHTWPLTTFHRGNCFRAWAYQKLLFSLNFVCLLLHFLLAPCLLQLSLGMIPMIELLFSSSLCGRLRKTKQWMSSSDHASALNTTNAAGSWDGSCILKDAFHFSSITFFNTLISDKDNYVAELIFWVAW